MRSYIARRHQLRRDRCIVTGIDQSSKVIPGRRGDIDISHSEQRAFDVYVTQVSACSSVFSAGEALGLSRNRDFRMLCAHDDVHIIGYIYG
jgi:hypothetical protein